MEMLRVAAAAALSLSVITKRLDFFVGPLWTLLELLLYMRVPTSGCVVVVHYVCQMFIHKVGEYLARRGRERDEPRRANRRRAVKGGGCI